MSQKPRDIGLNIKILNGSQMRAKAKAKKAEAENKKVRWTSLLAELTQKLSAQNSLSKSFCGCFIQ